MFYPRWEEQYRKVDTLRPFLFANRHIICPWSVRRMWDFTRWSGTICIKIITCLLISILLFLTFVLPSSLSYQLLNGIYLFICWIRCHSLLLASKITVFPVIVCFCISYHGRCYCSSSHTKRREKDSRIISGLMWFPNAISCKSLLPAFYQMMNLVDIRGVDLMARFMFP